MRFATKRAAIRRSIGFAQLRLVVCFLRWANLKEKPPERFDSPLVLLPVRLTKTKGVRDVYTLEPVGHRGGDQSGAAASI